jgi:ribosomal protein S27E
MTIVEKAAYLKGLAEGLGIEPDSRDGRLWGALTDLLSDMARQIEDLQAGVDDLSGGLDDLNEGLAMLETYVEDQEGSAIDWDDEDEDPDNIYDFGGFHDDEDEDEDEDEDGDEDEEGEEEPDGIFYEVTCPSCGEEINFGEETLARGSIQCPACGEMLELDLGLEADEDGEREAGDIPLGDDEDP